MQALAMRDDTSLEMLLSSPEVSAYLLIPVNLVKLMLITFLENVSRHFRFGLILIVLLKIVLDDTTYVI